MDQVWNWVEIILALFGGLGVFLAGMEMMSNSMSRLAHGKMKNLLNKTANNRFVGVGIGAAVTAIIQSSSATTVMVVGLVNAGVMSLIQATTIIMGANIGTTITSYMASFSDVPVSSLLFLFAIVGVFLAMLGKGEKTKILGSIFMGIGMIFVGLAFMGDAMNIDLHPEIKEPIENILSFVKNPFLLLLVGAVVTGIIQSSSAFTSLVVMLVISVGTGAIGGGGDGVLYLIIGSNIGTCVTALLSSIGASKNALRAAIIHLMFNVFGAVIFTTMLLLWGISGTSFVDVVLRPLAPNAPAFQISIFHTIFNVTCTALFLPFSKGFVWLAEHIIRDGKGEAQSQEETLVLSVDERLLLQPSLALDHIYQNTGKMFAFSMGTLDKAVEAFFQKDVSAKDAVLKDNAELAKINREMVSYLVKISASSLVMEDEKTISALHYVLNDIVRIGEFADNMTKYTNHYVNDGLVFSGEFLSMVRQMYQKLKDLYELASETFLKKDFSRLAEVDALEEEIDKERRRLVNTHIERLNEGKCQPQNSSVFINLVGNLERAADHITFIAHSIEQND